MTGRMLHDATDITSTRSDVFRIKNTSDCNMQLNLKNVILFFNSFVYNF